jgi:hypothetical protein
LLELSGDYNRKIPADVKLTEMQKTNTEQIHGAMPVGENAM